MELIDGAIGHGGGIVSLAQIRCDRGHSTSHRAAEVSDIGPVRVAGEDTDHVVVAGNDGGKLRDRLAAVILERILCISVVVAISASQHRFLHNY